jgi:hypothetical protein
MSFRHVTPGLAVSSSLAERILENERMRKPRLNPFEVYRKLRAEFSEQEQSAMTLLAVAIHRSNRRTRIGFRAAHPVVEEKAA